jgi:hypothetical protein
MAIFTTGQAGGQAIQPTSVPAAYTTDAQDLARSQRLAQMLTASPMPEGQMISGRYVAPSITQNLAQLANMATGAYFSDKAEKQNQALAEKLRTGETQAIADFMKTKQGTPAEMFAAQAGPMPTGGNIPLQESRAAVTPNPQAAYANLYQDPRSPQRLRDLAFTKMMADPEAFTLNEGAKRFMTMPDGTVKEVAAGSQKPRSPVSVGNYLINPETGKVIFQAPDKPIAGQVVERDDGTFLVDTRTGQAKPVIGANGQPLTGGGKPLTEAQGNSVAFGSRAIEANRIATELEKQGVTNTGAIRTAIGGVAGMTPFVGEQLEQGVRSALNPLPSVLGGPSGEQQQVEQARRNFVSAVLRKESGAAIGVDEYKNEERKYFPQVGDTDKVIKQKQDARKLAIDALKAQAGPSGVRQINQIVDAQLSPQDKEALNWASSNPNDPRSAQIRQRLGR